MLSSIKRKNYRLSEEQDEQAIIKRFALHDYFFAKSIDALKPDGVMALVTSHCN